MDSIQIGDQAIPYIYMEKPWIRNTYLRFEDKTLVVTARNFRSAAKVLNLHKDWITKHYSQLASSVRLFGSNSILFNGTQFQARHIETTARTRLEIGQNAISVYSKSPRLAENALDKWLSLQTKLFTDPMVGEKALLVGRGKPEVLVRKCGKWGVCKSNNTITFNSYVCMLPADIREYIVCHEVAHLVQMNHSGRFWGVVSSLCPNYRELRRRLKNYDNKRRSVYGGMQLT